MSKYSIVARDGSGKEIALRDLPEGDLVKAIQAQGVVLPPVRQRLPMTRRSITHKFDVAGHEGYVTVGLYESGQPGEMFITMAKEGSTMAGMMDSFGTSISMCLQYGVDGKVLCEKFRHSRFEPSGHTTNPEIPYAKSIMDYIFGWMGREFYDLELKSSEENHD